MMMRWLVFRMLKEMQRSFQSIWQMCYTRAFDFGDVETLW